MVHGTHNAHDDPRNASIQIWIDGELKARDEAKISVFDSGFLIGDGVWEGLRLHRGALVFLEEHLDRLWQGAAAIGLEFDFTRAELVERIERTLAANAMTDGVHVRVMVTRGTKKTPSQDPRLVIGGPNLVIIAEHKVADPSTRDRGVKLFTTTVRRGRSDYLDPRLNCHSKLHEVVALVQALSAGADEALMLDDDGFVATCNATNFFVVRRGEVWTSSGQYCMNGITRAKVLEACERHGIPARQHRFSLVDVYDADEAFVTGTFGGLTPAVEIDGRTIGDGTQGPMTHRLRELYEGLIEEALG